MCGLGAKISFRS